MLKPDIIVVGVGRTGTSTVARILQTKLGVRMAHNWAGASEFQPEGSYEEQKMFPYSYALVEKPHYQVSEWLGGYQKAYAKTTEELLGIKQTPLSLCTRAQWEELDPKLVIRTHRPKDQAVASMLRCRTPKDKSHWEKFYQQREKAMQRHLDYGHTFPVIRIYFDDIDRSTDEDLFICLEPWVQKVRKGKYA